MTDVGVQKICGWVGGASCGFPSPTPRSRLVVSLLFINHTPNCSALAAPETLRHLFRLTFLAQSGYTTRSQITWLCRFSIIPKEPIS